MNLYNDLELDKNASSDKIKQSYKKLCYKYHPDKNNSFSSEKFIKIKKAYEILSDENKKKEYDNTLKYSKINDNINNIFKIVSIFSELVLEKKQNNKCIDLDIIESINCRLVDRYNNNYQKIIIDRETKKDIELLIPIRDNITVFSNEGEIKNNDNGDIIINVEIINDTNYTIKDYDLYLQKEISLYNYLYGGSFEINHFDEIIEIDHKGFIGKELIIKIENKGLPKNKNNDRGNFYLILNISDLFIKKKLFDN